MRIRINLIVFLLFSFLIHAEEIKQPDECVKIVKDRERLQCFDDFFNTPVPKLIHEQQGNPVVEKPENVKPKEWYLNWEKETERPKGEKGFFMTTKPGNFQDSIFLTLPIENTGLLVLSCIDKISRIELFLDRPVRDGIVPVTVDGKRSRTENWLSDDTGFILRMGRGIPSIDVMKDMLGLNQIVLSFNKKSIAIPVEDLTEKVKPLRNICRW